MLEVCHSSNVLLRVEHLLLEGATYFPTDLVIEIIKLFDFAFSQLFSHLSSLYFSTQKD